MNLFVLDKDYTQAAIYNHDIHVKKICLESVQILQTAYPLNKLEDAPRTKVGTVRKHGYKNHPLCVWGRKNICNFQWALFHAHALQEEYLYRFGSEHFSNCFVKWAFRNEPELAVAPMTEHPQCFDEYAHLIKPGNPVQGYRDYYKAAKMSFVMHNKIVPATWTKRNIPQWIK